MIVKGETALASFRVGTLLVKPGNSCCLHSEIFTKKLIEQISALLLLPQNLNTLLDFKVDSKLWQELSNRQLDSMHWHFFGHSQMV